MSRGSRLALLHGRCGDSGQGSGQDSGQVSILMLGMVLVALTLLLGGIGTTAVHLGRIHLLDAADAAALDAADAVDLQTAYRSGVAHGLPLSDATVREAAQAHLAAREQPGRVSAWRVGQATGTPDGRTAVVQLHGTVRVPVVSTVLDALGGSVSVTVTSRARSDYLQGARLPGG